MTSPISKTAVDPAVSRAPSLFYASAREGMQDLLEHHARVHPEPTVLLPSFVGWSPREGSGVLDPVRGAGLTPTFYGLHADLSVDLADLEERLAGTTNAVVVLIHYYGRTLPQLEAAAELAHRQGAVVVEDLAHGFFSARTDGPAGRSGDVLMYSLHKMFPTPDASGGMLTYREPALLTGQASTRPELAAYVLDYDWRAIAAARRRNFALVLDGLRELAAEHSGFELFWPELADHDVPQTLPVRVLGGRRDDVYHRMNADGFGMVSLYHTLVPELRGNEAMSELASTVINFPVHQDLDPAAVPAMLASFAAALDAP
jgi:hypothetical protein